MNIENFKMVLDQIQQHPETWNQKVWHSYCGTKHCFAGWAQLLSGNAPDWKKTRQDAKAYLEINSMEADYLFSSKVLIEDLVCILERGSIYDSEGYDPSGHDHEGLKREDRE